MTKLIQGGLVALLLVAICLGWYSSVLLHRLDASQQLVAEQEKSMAQQTRLITTLQTQDIQNRALMAAQQDREQQLRQQASANERKYRDAIKNDECASRVAPDAVLDLLRETDANTTTSTNHPVAP